MEKDIFSKVFNNTFLFRFIYSKVYCIHKDILKCRKLYKWDKIIKDSPHILALYNYIDEIKTRNNSIGICKITNTDVIYSIKGNSLDVFRYFLQKKPKITLKKYNDIFSDTDYYDDYDLYTIAVLYHRWDIIHILESSVNTKWEYITALEKAPLSKDLALVRHVYSKCNIISISQSVGWILRNAAYASSIDIIDWLLETLCSENSKNYINLKLYHGEEILLGAIEGGHLRIIQQYYDLFHMITVDWNNLLETAARFNHLDILQYFYHRGIEFNSKLLLDIISHAAGNGNLELLIWLHHEYPNISFSGRTLSHAASSGHLNIVQWLHHNRIEGCTTDAMDYASYNGRFEVVKWLHENRTEGCTTSAMDNAASIGNLEIVKWLHYNRTEGCTSDAMDGAVLNGHLEIIKWLHENRTEGCSFAALKYAKCSGISEVMEWLINNRTEEFFKFEATNQDTNIETQIVVNIIKNQYSWLQIILHWFYQLYYHFFNK